MVYKKEEFSDTLAVKGSMIGRAPVAVSDTYVVLADRSGMNVNVYDSKQKEYPLLATLKVIANHGRFFCYYMNVTAWK